MTVSAIGTAELPILLINLVLFAGAIGGFWYLCSRIRRAI